LRLIDELEKTNLSRQPTKTLVDAELERKPRSKEEMALESEILRALFAKSSLPLPISVVNETRA
jgi:hypothetical protein